MTVPIIRFTANTGTDNSGGGGDEGTDCLVSGQNCDNLLLFYFLRTTTNTTSCAIRGKWISLQSVDLKGTDGDYEKALPWYQV